MVAKGSADLVMVSVSGPDDCVTVVQQRQARELAHQLQERTHCCLAQYNHDPSAEPININQSLED